MDLNFALLLHFIFYHLLVVDYFCAMVNQIFNAEQPIMC